MSMKTKQALLIINPTAGKTKNEDEINEIVNLLKEQLHIADPHVTSEKGDATEFVREYAKFHDMVICCGGDGTLNEVISGLMEMKHYIPIGFIPAGTTNDLANTFKMPKDIKKAVQFIFNGKPEYHDIGIMSDKYYFSYIASFGAFTKVSYETPQWLKNKIGHFAYVLDGIKSVGEIRPYKVKVKTEDFELEDEFIFGSVSNSLSIGGILKLDEDEVSFNDGKFEVLLIRNPHNAIDLSEILYGLSIRKYDEKYIIFLQTSEISFEFEEETNWTADGECAKLGKEVLIKNCHNVIQFIR